MPTPINNMNQEDLLFAQKTFLSELPISARKMIDQRILKPQGLNIETPSMGVLRSLVITRPPLPTSEETPEVQKAYDCIERLVQKESATERGEIVESSSLPRLNNYNFKNGFGLDVLKGGKNVAENISIWRGDITRLSADVVVNAANDQYLGCFVPEHRCVDNVLHWAAGPRMRRDCAEILEKDPSIKTENCLITSGHALPARMVAHTVGPQLQRGESVTARHVIALGKCYTTVLEESVRRGARSIAFPAISTGLFGFPRDIAAKVAIIAVDNFLTKQNNNNNNNNKIDDLHIILVPFAEIDEMAYRKVFNNNNNKDDSVTVIRNILNKLNDNYIENELRRAVEMVRRADRVLVMGAAGLSAAAGIDYTSKSVFKKHFPAMVERGFSCFYEFIGHQFTDDRLKWGYFADQVNLVRFQWPKSAVYEDLKAIAESKKEYFVRSSNADGQFRQHGFDPTRLHEPQGDYGLFQCLTPCSRDVYDTKEVLINNVLPHLDKSTQLTTKEAAAKVRCPKCGGEAFMNVRGGDWFIETDHQKKMERKYVEFLKEARGNTQERLVVLSIGAGYNTPTVIRWEAERVARLLPNADLIVINAMHAHIDDETLQEKEYKTVSLQMDAGKAIKHIKENLKKQ